MLRNIWEETSDQLELLQTENSCVKEQINHRQKVEKIEYKANFNYDILKSEKTVKMAIIREEGSNGDREMSAAFMMAGFEVYDVTMTDLANGITLDKFSGIAFVGGFSFADVLGSAKGWSAAILFNNKIKNEFERFKNRKDTFSFGICNGCQLMALIGWIGSTKSLFYYQIKLFYVFFIDNDGKVFLGENKCARFHSSFVSVKIMKSKAIMLQDMEDSVLGVWTSHGEGDLFDPHV